MTVAVGVAAIVAAGVTMTVAAGITAENVRAPGRQCVKQKRTQEKR